MGIKFYMCGSGNVYHLGCLKDAWGVWGVSYVFDNILCEFKKLKISKGGGGEEGVLTPPLDTHKLLYEDLV